MTSSSYNPSRADRAERNIRIEAELVTEAANKLLSGRVQSAADYFHMYMTADECRQWPNIRTFIRDVETHVRLTTA